ncbi:MAG: polyprenyl synthetase family protein [Chitinophagales bacterium]|nr:polyprenyl synthetase family protein [Bacteroidota bacterium]MCB9042277.1 polyprenyl synthetase family protein [Chitinophagales bacterium]
MALSLKQIQKPIEAELNAFEKKFRASMRSNVPLLDKVMHYIVQHKGKQMRPMFVFFSALLAGNIGEKVYRGATLIELLHTATLVHDDVVDDADKRRGFFSINALWKNKVAVLVGDYLLSKGLLLSVEHKDFSLLEIVSTAVREMSEGELLQMQKSRLLNITESVYYDIIQRKTASLIVAACGMGFVAAGGAEEQLAQLQSFALNAGIAFQIRDDLFDYGAVGIGKPTGIDIKEKKLTLPLIYALSQASDSEKRKYIYKIKNETHQKNTITEIIDWVKAKNGIAYAQNAMQQYQNAALEALKRLPQNSGNLGLEQLLIFTIERNK